MNNGENGLVGFEATALEMPQASGISHYTGQLLQALVQRGGGWSYVVLACRPLAGAVPPGSAVAPCRGFPNRSIWFQLVLPRLVSRLRPRLCHFTNSIAPVSLSCPFAVTFHDMSLFLFPSYHQRKSLWLVRSIIPVVARRAAAVITVSHSAKQDILSVLRLPPEKVHVVYHAAAPCYRVLEDQAELNRVRHKYGLERPFILSVGTIEPRKNLSRLVAAFFSLQKRGRQEQLVLAGSLGWHYGPLLKQIEDGGLRRSVRLLGYIPASDMPALYNLAEMVAFPSLYEGFGFPIVEAMACGTPVLTSNRSSMAEVGQNAAFLIDPTQETEIEQGLFRLLSDESLRDELRELGRARAAQFSWDRTAEETTRVYQNIITKHSIP